jgi:TetR/AcrR family transcriptional repressor of nem operon
MAVIWRTGASKSSAHGLVISVLHQSVQNAVMARPRTYDEDEVRRCALGAFLQHGYAETSLSDLEAASGLDRRQLYNGFGDKKALFAQSLDAFAEEAARTFLAPLESPDAGVADISNLLRLFADLSDTPRGRLGCMVCNAASEDVAQDADIKPRIETYFERIELAYRNALERAAARGELDMDRTAAVRRARLLLGTHVSLSVLARAGAPKAVLEDMVEEAIATLE